jgi:outer membrane lipoprotein
MPRSSPVPIALACAVAALSSCATPAFKDAPPPGPPPAEVAAAPERYHDATVVWGGKVLALDNLAQTTDVQVIAYPLDRNQRPDTRAPSSGRFVLSIPGYVEATDYPPGRWLSVRGRVVGNEVHRIQERDIVYPRIAPDEVHRWPREFPDEQGHWTFGIGVGLGTM